MRERAQSRLSSFAVRRGLLGFLILTSALGVTSCSDDSNKEARPPQAVDEPVAPDPRPWRTEYRGDIATTLTSQRVRQCAEFRYLEESSDPPTYLVECLETGDQFHVVPSRGEVTSTLKLERQLAEHPRQDQYRPVPRICAKLVVFWQTCRPHAAGATSLWRVTERWLSTCPAVTVLGLCGVRSALRMESLQTCGEAPPNQATAPGGCAAGEWPQRWAVVEPWEYAEEGWDGNLS